jgi:ferredoxin
MAVRGEECISCGLCVSRCHVGAVSLDLRSGTAVVTRPDGAAYERVTVEPDEFVASRDAIAAVVTPEVPPFDDASAVIRQIELASPILSGQSGQRLLRLLARNAFVLAGSAARLKNPGDNNAWCELTVDDGDRLLVVEVEPGGDLLDAMRRALAGCAIAIARQGVDKAAIAGGLVIPRLPNERVDYYQVVQDVRSRLDVETFTIPLALLLLDIRSGGIALRGRLGALCTMGEGRMATIKAVFGEIDDPATAGLLPAK